MPVLAERDGALVVQAREEIVQVELMLQHHERDDVAGSRRVGCWVEERFQLGHVAVEVRLALLPRELLPANQIAAMSLRAVRAADVPAAPAFRQRGAMIHERNARAQIHHAALVRGEGAHQMSRHPHRLGRGVTFQALVVADEARFLRGRLVERVEDRAELRVRFGDFQQGRAGHVTDIHIVAEEEGARMFRVDALALERGFGEHEHLR